MNTLIIRHLPESDPPRFQVEREDHKASTPVAVQPPFGLPVEGRPASDLMQELRVAAVLVRHEKSELAHEDVRQPQSWRGNDEGGID